MSGHHALCAQNLILGNIFGTDGNEYIHERSLERYLSPRASHFEAGSLHRQEEFKTFGDCQGF